MRRGAVGLILLLLAPLAAGAPVQGEFRVEGALSFPEEAVVAGALLGAFAPDVRDATHFELTAATATITVYEATFARVAGVPNAPRARTGSDEARFEIHDATFRLDAASFGWMGIEPAEGAVLQASAPERMQLDAVDSLVLGNGQSGDNPRFASVHQAIASPLVAVDGAQTIGIEGGATLKIIGLNLSWTARENASALRTGWVSEGPASERQTWAILTFREGRLAFAAPGGVVAALAEAEVESDGRVAFRAREAELLDDDGVAYALPPSGAVELDGLVVTRVVPEPEGRALVRVQGDVGSTTMVPRTPVGGGLASGVGPWLALALVGTVATVSVLLRRRRGEDPGPDECSDLAGIAADAGRFDEALAWVRRARRQSPTSARLLLDEAYYAWRAGEREAARAAFAIARERSDSAQAELMEARLLLEDGRAAEARELVIAALDKAPIVLLEVEAEDRLLALLADARAREAAGRARRRLS